MAEANVPTGLARNADPETSHAAGQAILKDRTAIQRMVLEMFARAHPYGLTDYELEDRCGSHNSTYRTRRAELVESGYLMDSGEKRVLRDINNKGRVVWMLKPRPPVQMALFD